MLRKLLEMLKSCQLGVELRGVRDGVLTMCRMASCCEWGVTEGALKGTLGSTAAGAPNERLSRHDGAAAQPQLQQTELAYRRLSTPHGRHGVWAVLGSDLAGGWTC